MMVHLGDRGRGSLSAKPYLVPGQSGQHRETLSQREEENLSPKKVDK